MLLGGFGGLRTGELLGLQRRDVDLVHATVTVVRQSHEITGQGRIFTAPKNDAGYRTVALPSLVLSDLEEHLSHHVEVRPDAPLFTRPLGLPARNPNVTLRELMATIGHSSHVAALRYQHATAERSKAIAEYLDEVIRSAQSAQESARGPPSVRKEPRHLRGIRAETQNTVRS